MRTAVVDLVAGDRRRQTRCDVEDPLCPATSGPSTLYSITFRSQTYLYLVAQHPSADLGAVHPQSAIYQHKLSR